MEKRRMECILMATRERMLSNIARHSLNDGKDMKNE